MSFLWNLVFLAPIFRQARFQPLNFPVIDGKPRKTVKLITKIPFENNFVDVRSEDQSLRMVATMNMEIVFF